MNPSLQGIIIALLISLLIGIVVGFYLRQSHINELSDDLQKSRKRNQELEQEHERRLQTATLQLQQDYESQLTEKIEQYQQQYNQQIAQLEAEYNARADLHAQGQQPSEMSPDAGYGEPFATPESQHAIEQRIRTQYEVRLKEAAYKIQQAYEHHLKEKLNESRDLIQQDYEQRLAEKIQYYQNQMDQRLSQSNQAQEARLMAMTTDGDAATMGIAATAGAAATATQLRAEYEAKLAEKIEYYQDEFNRRVEALEREYEARTRMVEGASAGTEGVGAFSDAGMTPADRQALEASLRDEIEVSLRAEYDQRLAETIEQYQDELGQRTQELEDQLAARLQLEQQGNVDVAFVAGAVEFPRSETDLPDTLLSEPEPADVAFIESVTESGLPETEFSETSPGSTESEDLGESPGNFVADTTDAGSMPEVVATPDQPADTWSPTETMEAVGEDVAALGESVGDAVADTTDAWSMPDVEPAEAVDNFVAESQEAVAAAASNLEEFLDQESSTLEEFLSESDEEPADTWSMSEVEATPDVSLDELTAEAQTTPTTGEETLNDLPADADEATPDDWPPTEMADEAMAEAADLGEFMAEAVEDPADSWAPSDADVTPDDWPPAAEPDVSDQSFELNDLLATEAAASQSPEFSDPVSDPLEQALGDEPMAFEDTNLDDLLIDADSELEAVSPADNLEMALVADAMAESAPPPAEDAGFDFNDLLDGDSGESPTDEAITPDDLGLGMESPDQPTDTAGAEDFGLGLELESSDQPTDTAELEDFGLGLDLESPDQPIEPAEAEDFGLGLDLETPDQPAAPAGGDDFDLDFALEGDASSESSSDPDLDFGFAMDDDTPTSPDAGADDFGLDDLDTLLDKTEGDDNAEEDNLFDNLDDLSNL
jgi:hypothetical protein